MKYLNLINRFCIIIFLLPFLSCTTNTNITGSWVNPDAPKKSYNNILVTALVDDVGTREKIENDIARKMQDLGIQITKSMDVFPPKLQEEDNNEEALISAINENQYDGIITITLVEEKTETMYSPGAQIYSPTANFGYYGNFRGYYNNRYTQVYNNNYYDRSKVYFMETNLYDASNEELIWSAQSETVNPGSLDSFSGMFASKMIEEMRKEDFLKK